MKKDTEYIDILLNLPEQELLRLKNLCFSGILNNDPNYTEQQYEYIRQALNIKTYENMI